MATTTSTNTFLQRLIGAMALDPAIYEEVEADRSATLQAFVVVVGSSLAAGIGALGLGDAVNVGTVAFVVIVSLMLWAAWALLTFEIGVRLMPGRETRSSVGELLRTLGFSATPGFLRVIGIVPPAARAVFLITSVWMLASMIVAVRHALDYRNTSRAIVVCIVGWALAVIIAVGIGLLFSPTVS